MAQDTIIDNRLRNNTTSKDLNTIDKHAVHHENLRMDGFWIYMMQISLLIAYGIVWTMNLFRRKS